MDLAAAAARCREETDKFRRQLPSDPAFCLQLWQYALHGATAAERELAWQYVDAQYRPQVREWFTLHELAPLVEHYGTKDDFAQSVFLKLVKVNQEVPLRAESLKEILAYVRTCLVNEILMAARRRHPPLDSLDDVEPVVRSEGRSEDPADRVTRQEEVLEVWRRLCACAVATADPHDPAAQERQVRLITLRWAQGYPPADIVKTFPEEFADVQEIFRVLAKVKVCYKRKYASGG